MTEMKNMKLDLDSLDMVVGGIGENGGAHFNSVAGTKCEGNKACSVQAIFRCLVLLTDKCLQNYH